LLVPIVSVLGGTPEGPAPFRSQLFAIPEVGFCTYLMFTPVVYLSSTLPSFLNPPRLIPVPLGRTVSLFPRRLFLSVYCRFPLWLLLFFFLWPGCGTFSESVLLDFIGNPLAWVPLPTTARFLARPTPLFGLQLCIPVCYVPSRLKGPTFGPSLYQKRAPLFT